MCWKIMNIILENLLIFFSPTRRPAGLASNTDVNGYRCTGGLVCVRGGCPGAAKPQLFYMSVRSVM